MADEEKTAFEQFKKLEELFVTNIYYVLEVSKSEENTRRFFEKCLKRAQARYADAHIVSGLSKGLDSELEKAQEELDKKRRMVEALRNIASE
jgi:predicted aldo/keto reductase-like oxidoreductase